MDGYNVIFAWKELSELAKVNLDGARLKLLDILCNYQGITGVNLIAVFDAYKIAGHDTEYSFLILSILSTPKRQRLRTGI